MIVGLAACGSKETVIIEREVEKTQPSYVDNYEEPDSGSYSQEDIFLATFRSEYPEDYYVFGPDLLVETGKVMCDSIDRGMTLDDLAISIQENGLEPEMIGFLVGAAVNAFCPENMWWIDRYSSY